MDDALIRRAELHAALGDPVRLAIVESLRLSDRAPSDLARDLGIGSNLLAHHLNQLRLVGCIRETVSSGDRRRRYVQLMEDSFDALSFPPLSKNAERVLFVCTHNSARSQLAAALFVKETGRSATSAGTHPAETVHPLTLQTAQRHGLDLRGASPRGLASVEFVPDVLVTVCDQANEALGRSESLRLHWSVPDPAEAGDEEAFEDAYLSIKRRVQSLAVTFGL